MMRRLSIVAQREYLQGLRSRWFLIGTIGLPIFMLAILGLTLLLATMQTDRPVRLVLLDESGAIGGALAEEFPEKLPSGERRVQVEVAEVDPGAEVSEVVEQMRERVLARQIDAYLHLSEDFVRTGEAELYGLNVSNIDLNQRLETALSRLRRIGRIVEAGVRPEEAEALLEGASLETYRLGPEGARPDDLQTFALVYLLVILLYFTVILYGATIGRSIVEEKVSRIIEVMLSSVRPFELLAGKVLGVGGVGLTQTLVWVMFGGILLGLRGLVLRGIGGEDTFLAGIPTPSAAMAFFFLLWFVLGYFLYALMFALVGSIVGTEEEAQQLQMPISLILLMPLVSQAAIIQNPDSTFSVVMSFIPFFAPVVMFLRIAVLTPPLGQIFLSVALTFVTILMLLWITSRIYRVGILSYGKRPRLREIVRWAFASY